MKAILPPEPESALKEDFFGHARTGYFVDVGANDPQMWSQSFHLETLGWRGVLVEPQPDLAERLRARRLAKVYAVACSSPANAGKTMTLHLAGIYSSLAADLSIATVRPEGSVEVPIMTLDALLTDAGAPAPIDFLSVDVEGHEIDVLSGFDLARWRPRLILIEDLVLNLDLHKLLVARGYKWVRRTGLNSWYVPADNAMELSLSARREFIRKYYLGVPFRLLREALRRLRTRLGWRLDPVKTADH
jgi:FkbM family methyltransferase